MPLPASARYPLELRAELCFLPFSFELLRLLKLDDVVLQSVKVVASAVQALDS